MFKPIAEEQKNLEFINVFPDKKMIVSLDKNLFVQIINNLLDNAVKYTKEGQIAEFELYQIPLPSIEDVPQYEVQL